jgi:hypothetical protein
MPVPLVLSLEKLKLKRARSDDSSPETELSSDDDTVGQALCHRILPVVGSRPEAVWKLL